MTPLQTSRTPFTDAAGAKTGHTFNPDIVKYKTATPQQRAIMDPLIADLKAAIADNDPTVISDFGKDPSDRLGDTSLAILREVQSTNSFLGSFKGFGEKISSFDFDSVGEIARDYSENIQRKMQIANIKNPIMRVLKKLMGSVFSIGREKSTAEDLRHEIDKSILQFGEVISGLEEAKDKIPGLSRKLKQQEDARLEAYSEYGLYVGAALEVYERMKDEVIPALEAKAAQTGSALDAREVRVKKVSMTAVNRQATSMDTFHKSCLAQLETIDDLKGALVMSQVSINSHLTTSRNEWLAFLSESTSAATMSEIAEATQQADQFGDKIFEQAQTLSDITTNMAKASFEHGAVDAEKVAKFLQQKAVKVLESVRYIDEANARFEGKRELLDSAAKELIAAKANVNSNADAEAAVEKIKRIEDNTASVLVEIEAAKPVKSPQELKKEAVAGAFAKLRS